LNSSKGAASTDNYIYAEKVGYDKVGFRAWTLLGFT